jgi:heat shock protein HtpX
MLGFLLRTWLLFSILTGIVLAIGFLIGGYEGLLFSLILSFFINIFSYYYSDKIVLGIYNAKPLKNKRIESILENLCKKANIPKPALYLVDMDIPNAFATGRSPKHSAVAVTSGLIENLNDEEIESVIAHEITHIKNRDVLLATLAAVFASAITYIAYMFRFSDKREDYLSTLLLIIFAPFIATIIRLAISRTREYAADYGSAVITKNPSGLIRALEKISQYAKNKTIRGNAATSHLWIVNPFKGGLEDLFSTHPSVNKRIERLKSIKL